jgi:cobaltochelatase CobN
VLTGDELVEEVFTIALSMTKITEHMKIVLYPSISVNYYAMQKESQYEEELESINNQIRTYIDRIANGEDPNSLGVTNTDLLNDLSTVTKPLIK